MAERRRPGLVAGLVLILLGLWFLAVQLVPGVRQWAAGITLSWPLIVIAVGVALLLMGLLTGAAGMAVPACIVGGIGGLLYWQNATGNWGSWSYAWALIPGFVGVGTLLMGAWERNAAHVRDGLQTILVSLVLFAIFGSFFGGGRLFGPYWPGLLILLGLWLLIRPRLRARGRASK